MTSKFKNILYLHGFRNNEEIMHFQTRKLRRLLPERNHHIINGLYVAKEDSVDESITKHFKGPYYEHCQFEYLPDRHVKYFGIDRTIDYLRKIAVKKEIDGIVAFSQGSYIASILSNEYKLKFLVSVCGMPCLDEQYQIDPTVPAYHIIGEQDHWFERGKQFHGMYSDAVLHQHENGHCFPNEIAVYKKVVSWMEAL